MKPIVNSNQSARVLSPENLASLDSIFRIATAENISHFIKIWEEIILQPELLRVMVAPGEIGHKGESFFDNILISLCGPDFKEAAWVVGSSMANINMNDRFLFWRLKELTGQKKLEAKGTFQNIRTCEVRLSATYQSA